MNRPHIFDNVTDSNTCFVTHCLNRIFTRFMTCQITDTLGSAENHFWYVFIALAYSETKWSENNGMLWVQYFAAIVKT